MVLRERRRQRLPLPRVHLLQRGVLRLLLLRLLLMRLLRARRPRHAAAAYDGARRSRSLVEREDRACRLARKGDARSGPRGAN